jgi:hypothetical protein
MCIATQQDPLIPDLAGNDLCGPAQRALLVVPSLRTAKLDILARRPLRPAIQPAAVTEVEDSDASSPELRESLSAHLHVADGHDVAHVDQALSRKHEVLARNDDETVTDPDASTWLGDIERARVGGARNDPAWRRRTPGQHQVRFVGQADGGERASRALWTVDERGRRAISARHRSRRRHRGTDLLVSFLGHGNGDPRVSPRVGEDGLLHLIALGAQEGRLSEDLDAIRGPRRSVLLRPSLLVVDWRDRPVLVIDAVDHRHEPEILVLDAYGSCRRRPRLVARVGDTAGARIDVATYVLPLRSVVIVRPTLVDPLQIEQPRAVDELVEHARRQERGYGVVVGHFSSSVRFRQEESETKVRQVTEHQRTSHRIRERESQVRRVP